MSANEPKNLSADSALVETQRSPDFYRRGDWGLGAGRPRLSAAEKELRRLNRAHGHRLLPVVIRGWRDVLSLRPIVVNRLREILEDPKAEPAVVLAAGKLIARVQDNVADRFGMPRRAEFENTSGDSRITPEALAKAYVEAAQRAQSNPGRGDVIATDAEYEVIPNTNGNGQTVQ